jgi:uncharacterized protein YggE
MKSAWLALFLTAALASAQTTGAGSRSSVRSTGDGSVSVTPDQARVQVSAITQATTAQTAATQNASIAANIIAQLTSALGTSGTVKTVSYTISPTYNYPAGGTPVLTVYTVTNTIEVMLSDVTIAGKIVDTATQAGATRIDSLQFSLKDDTAARTQALRAATLKAKSKADAMAASVGLKTGAIIVIQESGAVVQPLTSTLAAATPIQPGTLNVTANVTLEVELVQ